MNKVFYEYFRFTYGIDELSVYWFTFIVTFCSLWTNFFLLMAIEFDDKKFSRHFHKSHEERKPQELGYSRTTRLRWLELKLKTMVSYPKTMKESIQFCHGGEEEDDSRETGLLRLPSAFNLKEEKLLPISMIK